MSSCSHKLEYRGDFGKGLLPADESAGPYLSLAAAGSTLYARLPYSFDDPAWRGQVIAFSLPEGRALGPFKDAQGRDATAQRLFQAPGGQLGLAQAKMGAGPKPAMGYEISLYSAEGVFSRSAFLPSTMPGDSLARPLAISFALAESGDALVLYAESGDRGRTGIAVHPAAFAPGGAAPPRFVDLESFRGRLPVTAGGNFAATSLSRGKGLVFITVEMSSEPFDGVLVLDDSLGFKRYISGEWAFNDPVAAATDERGVLYVANRWEDNVTAFSGGLRIAETAKDYMHGREGLLMARPGALAVSGGELYVFDGGNGRIARFSTVRPGANPALAKLDAFVTPIVPRNVPSDGPGAWLLAFVLGFFMMISLHGFFVGIASRERVFVLLGLCSLTALLSLIASSYESFYADLSSSGAFSVFLGLYMAAIAVFTRDYLSLPDRAPGLGRALVGMSAFAACFSALDAALSMAGPASLEAFFLACSDVLGLVYIGAFGFILASQSLKGNREARISLALSAFLLLSGALSIGKVHDSLIAGGPLDPLFASGYPLMLGYLIQSLALSLDLGSKLGSMKAARERTLKENESLKETDRLKDDFVMNVSHELRTPLSLILGVAERLGSGAEGDSISANAEGLDVIRRNALKLQKDIENLLDLSRLHRRGAEARKAAVRLAPLFGSMLSEFSALSRTRGVSLSLVPVDPGLAVLADRELLETALLNILSNALKYTPPGGRVELAAYRSPDGRGARLEVSDSGPGMDSSKRKEIFRRYFQGDPGRRFGGAGIGLHLAQEAVALQGGKIEVESEPGKGSRFSIVLACEKGPLEGEVAETDPGIAGKADRYRAEFEPASSLGRGFPGRAGKSKGSILFAEDNPDLRAFVSSVFGLGFRLRCAADGAEALRLLEEEIPDCVVSDMMMPGMGGTELHAAMRADPRLKAVPFLFLTARADSAERLKSLKDGALDYIEKPFSPSELVAKVESLIAWNRASAEKLKARIKESVAAAIDGMDAAGLPADRGAAAFDYGGLFRERGLSNRETEVARLILEGLGDKEIAQSLRISASTVGNHNSSIFHKLGISSRVELLAMRGSAETAPDSRL
jgi:signal transduction histidine kinase/DNA-binding NarL/FixJ family response regulator